MTFLRIPQPVLWLPQLNAQVWILAAGRFLSGIGTGFTMFYTPIFFAGEVGLTKTAVGVALGCASISGVFGRILSGSLTDSPAWGRRRTLLLSNLICAGGSLVLAAAGNFPLLVAGNLLQGFGLGLYWPATEVTIADLTHEDNRHEAYALMRVADTLGLQLGVVLGGVLVSLTGAYRALFVIHALFFLVFFAFIYAAIAETCQPALTPAPSLPLLKKGSSHSRKTGKTTSHSSAVEKRWAAALRDRAFLVYLAVNIMFTTYACQIQSTMPLYLNDFVRAGEASKGLSPTVISALFTWYMAVLVVFQLPVAKLLRRLSCPQGLICSALLWEAGFILISFASTAVTGQLVWAILGLGVLAIAFVTYSPSASSLMASLAPKSLRGFYFSINSQCWAIGYLIGPPLGGWALEQSRLVAHSFWLVLSLSACLAVLTLQYLDRLLGERKGTATDAI